MKPSAEAFSFNATQVRSRLLRILLSILLVLHLCAIVVAPLAVAPASILNHRGWQLFRPYLEIAYLNHGYHFFAPEPGPSHLIRYELEMRDGSRRQGVFPNLEEHRPRLAYHRHFMLSEFLNSLISDDADSEAAAKLTRSYARHLLTEHQAQRVSIFLRRHYIPSPEQVLRATRLDDAVLYAEKPLGTFDKERL